MTNVKKAKLAKNRSSTETYNPDKIGVIIGRCRPEGMPLDEAGPCSWCEKMVNKVTHNYGVLKALAGLQLANNPRSFPFCRWQMKAVFLITDVSIDPRRIDDAACRFARSYGTYTEALRRTNEVRHVRIPYGLQLDEIAEIAANEVALARNESEECIRPEETLILIWSPDGTSFEGEELEAVAQHICQTVFTVGTKHVPPFQPYN